jgi:hypothetical protein
MLFEVLKLKGEAAEMRAKIPLPFNVHPAWPGDASLKK